MSPGACNRLPEFNLSLTTLNPQPPPSSFFPSFFLSCFLPLVCVPLQEARAELPQDEAGPVQRSV